MTDRKTKTALLNKIIAFVQSPAHLDYLFIVNFGIYAVMGYFVYTGGYPVNETIRNAIMIGFMTWYVGFGFAKTFNLNKKPLDFRKQLRRFLIYILQWVVFAGYIRYFDDGQQPFTSYNILQLGLYAVAVVLWYVRRWIFRRRFSRGSEIVQDQKVYEEG